MTMRKFKINIDGKSFVAEVEEIGASPAPASQPSPKPAAPAPTVASTPVSPSSGNAVLSPMPGKIIRVTVTKGQQIKAGDVVVILEAMKMEQEIKSSLEGTVSDIAVSDGETVKKEQTLIIVS